MNIWSIVFYGLLLFLVGVWVCERLPRWRAADTRARRDQLTEEQFGERFFAPGLSQIATRLRRIASEQFGKDLSRLHPEDRVAGVFSDSFDSLETVELVMRIEEEFGIELDDAAAIIIVTFRDLVNAVAARRPFLVTWQCRLGRAIEEQFGVSLSRDALATMATPDAATDAIAATLQNQLRAQETCQSQRAFYLLRSATMRTLQVPRSFITPRTPLSTLIHWRTAPSVWAQLRDSVGAKHWPPLVRPWWLNWLNCGIPLLGGAVLVVGLPPFADWAFTRSNTLLGFVLSFASGLRGFLVIALLILSWVLLVRVSKPLSFGLPRGICTVGDLLPFVVTSAAMTWTREQIEQKVREIVATQLPK